MSLISKSARVLANHKASGGPLLLRLPAIGISLLLHQFRQSRPGHPEAADRVRRVLA
jgi:hypothetical protein